MGLVSSRRSRSRRDIVVAALVVGGLAVSVVYSVAGGAPEARMPGVALGSEALLVAERSAAFFAIWLLALIAVVNALGGRLPIEVSGRGIKYADAPATQAIAEEADQGLEEIRVEIAQQREELGELQRAVMTKKGYGGANEHTV